MFKQTLTLTLTLTLALTLALTLTLTFLFSGCEKKKESLIIFHAGSLSSSVRDLVEGFRELYPGVEVRAESAGSRESARKVSELKRKADIVATSDYQVIQDILMPEYSDWYIKFARNRMVIVFTDKSKYGSEIDSNNWYKILSRKDVKFGRSDPDLDPCGYRTLMLWQLADLYYKQKLEGKNIYDTLLENCPPNNVRPSELELLFLLQSVALDYAFEYLSIAIQHNLKYIILPEEIDLSNPSLDEWYRQAKVTLTGKEPGKYSTVYGTSIVYGLTIPKDAPNYELAVKFLKFLLSEKGEKIMEKNGQPLLMPVIANDISKIPVEFKEYLRQ